MPDHLPECELVTSYPPNCGGFGIIERRCAAGCPVRARMFSPAANAAAALRFIRARYGGAGGWTPAAGTGDAYVPGGDRGGDGAVEVSE
jgi:hypothetical protein